MRLTLLFCIGLLAFGANAAGPPPGLLHTPWTTNADGNAITSHSPITNTQPITVQGAVGSHYEGVNTPGLWVTGGTTISGIQIDPRNYGAKGDGITDDTAALQSAFNALTNNLPAADYNNLNLFAPPSSLRVIIPAGTYRITAPLKVYSFSHITGIGTGSCITNSSTNTDSIYIGWSNNDPYAYTNAAPWRMSKNIVIENLQLAGSNNRSNAHSAASIQNHGLHIDGALRCQFKNLYIHDFGGSGIEDNRSEFCEYQYNHVQYCRVGYNKDNTGASGDATGLDNATCTIIFNRFQVGHVGARFVKTSANNFAFNEVEDNVAQIFNMTTDGTYNGPKKEPDLYYYPSVAIWLGDSAQNNNFFRNYVENSYVDYYFETNQGGIVGNVFMMNTVNPTDTTGKPDSETCAKHDIFERQNLAYKTIGDGTNNQAFVVFATSALDNAFVKEHWANNTTPILAAQKINIKRVVWSVDDFTYPIFDECTIPIYDDNTSVWSGSNPRIRLKVLPGVNNNGQAYLAELNAAIMMGGDFAAAAPTTFAAGLYPKTFAWDAAYVGANNLVQSQWFGDGISQRSVWTTVNHRTGAATTYPGTGAWSQGDVIWNKSASTNLPSGWICVTAGTPGVWKEFGSYHIAADGVNSDTASYAIHGVTRINSAADLAYYAMVRNASIVWALGIDQSNNMIIGQPNTFKQIPSPVVKFSSGGQTYFTADTHTAGDVYAGYHIATNGFATGANFGINATNTITAISNNWAIAVNGGIVTAVTATPNALTIDKVLIDAADTGAGYLAAKLVPGSNITFVTNNVAGVESITIAAASGSGSGPTNLNFIAPLAIAGTNVSVLPNGIDDSLLRQGTAWSVIGRGANSAGNVSDIIANSEGDTLQLHGTTLAFRPPLPDMSNQRVAIQSNSVAIATRPTINLIAGANVSFTAADNVASNRVDITLTAVNPGSQSSDLILTSTVDTDYIGANPNASTYSNVTVGGTNLSVALPAAGTYQLMASVGVHGNDIFKDWFKFRDSTTAFDVSPEFQGSVRASTSQTYRLTLQKIVTVAGADTIVVQGRSEDAVYGDRYLVDTSWISYVRLQ